MDMYEGCNSDVNSSQHSEFTQIVNQYQTIWAQNKGIMPSFTGKAERVCVGDILEKSSEGFTCPKSDVIREKKEQSSLFIWKRNYAASQIDVREGISNVESPYDPISNYIAASSKNKALYVHTAAAVERGGGVMGGVDNREADICRRTNYRKALRNLPYPMNIGDMNYCKGVIITRNHTYSQTNFRKSPKYIDILGVAIEERPPVVGTAEGDVYENDRNYNDMQEILYAIAEFAIKERYKMLVFDSFAIGGKSNEHPIEDFCTIFKEVFGNLGKSLNVMYCVHPGEESGELRFERVLWHRIVSMDNTGKAPKLPHPHKPKIETPLQGKSKPRRPKKVVCEEGVSDSSASEYTDGSESSEEFISEDTFYQKQERDAHNAEYYTSESEEEQILKPAKKHNNGSASKSQMRERAAKTGVVRRRR